MRTLNIDEAALLLKLHPEELRRRAKLGVLPAAKIGRSWVFIENDLVTFIRQQYSVNWRTLQGAHDEKEQTWHSTNEGKSIGLTSQQGAAKELAALLKPTSKRRLKNYTTS